MSLLSTFRTESSRARTGIDPRNRIATQLEALMKTIAARELVKTEFNRVRDLLVALPESPDEPDWGVRRLARAQRYLRSDEIGSALYELQLLLGALQRR